MKPVLLAVFTVAKKMHSQQDKIPSAIVLLSGGLDSATVFYIVKQTYKVYTLSFDYGQRHRIELEAAAKLARANDSSHLQVKLDPALFRQTALVGKSIEVPDYADSSKGDGESLRSAGDPIYRMQNIPVTYVPGRNTLFLSSALSYAESMGISDIFIGANAIDYSGYPDCRPEYIQAFETMANLATKAGVEAIERGEKAIRIHSPLINMTKAEIIKEGQRLGLDYSLTHSCYNPDASGRPCGKCDSCFLRKKGFTDAGLVDPLLA